MKARPSEHALEVLPFFLGAVIPLVHLAQSQYPSTGLAKLFACSRAMSDCRIRLNARLLTDQMNIDLFVLELLEENVITTPEYSEVRAFCSAWLSSAEPLRPPPILYVYVR